MNTIPITFDERKIPYTVIGGLKKSFDSTSLPVTVVLLSRGDRFARQQAVRDLSKFGFHDILSIEEPNSALETDGLAQAFPYVRFLVPGEIITVGEAVNLGIKESSTEAVLVLMSDMKIAQAGVSIRFFDRFLEQKDLCWAPVMSQQDGTPIPCAIAPAFSKKGIKLLQIPAGPESKETLYPYDYSGVYNREKFIMLGGYDYTITNTYWQKADFGFRSRLWGEKISLSHSLKVSYGLPPTPENSTYDESYKRFFLKNLTVYFSGDSGRLPFSAFFSYWLKSGTNPINALSEFKQARKWIEVNKYRFKSNANTVIDLWEDGKS